MYPGDITDRGLAEETQGKVALSRPLSLYRAPGLIWGSTQCDCSLFARGHTMCMFPNSEEMSALFTTSHRLSPALCGGNLMTISLGPFPRLRSAFLAIVAHLSSHTTQMGATEAETGIPS